MQAIMNPCPRCNWDDSSAIRRTGWSTTLLCCNCGLLFEVEEPAGRYPPGRWPKATF
jgi:transcription elongation factor Elf1